MIDKKTKIKTTGYYDYEIVDRWSEALQKTFKRRLQRSRDKLADENFFATEKRRKMEDNR